MAITPIDPVRVVPIRTLKPKDKVRLTLTKHGVFDTPIADPESQLVGLVHDTFASRSGSVVVRVSLPGEATTRSFEDNWTVELLTPALMKGGAQ